MVPAKTIGADAAAAHYRPHIWPTTPAGWVGWSWVDPFNSEKYEDVVRRNPSSPEAYNTRGVAYARYDLVAPRELRFTTTWSC